MLIGIVIGWILYALMIGAESSIGEMKLFAMPEWFAFGMPIFDYSVIPIAFVTAIILISNVVASIVAVNQILGMKKQHYKDEVNRGTTLSGMNHGIAGIFSAIANVPLATSAGFISLTGQKK